MDTRAILMMELLILHRDYTLALVSYEIHVPLSVPDRMTVTHLSAAKARTSNGSFQSPRVDPN